MIVPTPDVSLEDAEAALDGAIAEFMDEGVDQEQFDRLKSQLRASLIYDEDNIEGLARRYGELLTLGLTLDDIQAWPDVLGAVTPDDVMAAARAVFDKSNAVTGWLMPDAPQAATEVTQ